ncbi:MAG: hypothetical protein KDA92_18480 [Planctomycetales bacterium]|nr:hypothetical protein [Planctomycetales bacterium]
MKVLAWFAIAFLAFLVITGPAFWGTIQENSQQSLVIESQMAQIDKLKGELNSADAHLTDEVNRQVASARTPLEQDLKAAQATIAQLQQQIDSLSSRSEFEQRMHQNLDQVASRINELEQQAIDAADDEEINLRTQIAVLQTRRNQLEEKLDSLDFFDAEAWQHVKQELSADWNELSAAIPAANLGGTVNAVARLNTLDD